MTTDSTGGRIPAAARRFGRALPLAAVLLVLHPAPLPADPGPSATPFSTELPALGELITGSASGSGTMPDSADNLVPPDTGDATTGSPLQLGSGSAATWADSGATDSTGAPELGGITALSTAPESLGGPGASIGPESPGGPGQLGGTEPSSGVEPFGHAGASGSAGASDGLPTDGDPESPDGVADGGGGSGVLPLSIGSGSAVSPGGAGVGHVDTDGGGGDIAIGAADAAYVTGDVAGTAGELLGFEPGSVATACAGSAVLGSAALAAGSVAGSGGSGSLLPGLLVGGGSSGSGAGSVVVGSAAAGSALLTCLLLLPVPEPPGIPLELGPAAVPPVAAPPEPQVPVRTPEPPARTPLEPAIPVVAAPTPRPPAPPAAAPYTGWTTLQMMTVRIITLIAAARVRALRVPRA
ncbi:hypothetical protein FOH10_08025 [Nocardia otitidiscaviarum]|uniref:Uncharacterized protein n=1 Tax=Nocardia otitidiscaviarum TaxID=1823 RepID=A0A516NIG9_9NOCA|nr:hypothetical protein [Nocardia otitidiscaviarum]QDP78696.1 hypothetical protein FOH10_08025 [Nocardia otitidiscaviarum]